MSKAPESQPLKEGDQISLDQLRMGMNIKIKRNEAYGDKYGLEQVGKVVGLEKDYFTMHTRDKDGKHSGSISLWSYQCAEPGRKGGATAWRIFFLK